MKFSKRFIPLVVLLLAALGTTYYLRTIQHALPKTIALSNGRIEAQLIDVATRSAGRVVSVAVEEGDMVQTGAVLATLDLNHMAAALEGAKASVRAADKQQAEAAATLAQMQSALVYAQKEYQRASSLVKSGAVSSSRGDQALDQKQSAKAALDAAEQRFAAAQANVEAAQAEVIRQADLLTDTSIKAPMAGRVLYKLAEPGEVLASGGKVITMIDLSDVYMTVFFPTDVVGKLHLGDEARIVLDAFPDITIPATISYISPEAQFTPRQVETHSEREKMSFRVKVRIPAPLLRKHLEAVKTGLPGVAYVRTDPQTVWPAFLTVKPELLAESKE